MDYKIVSAVERGDFYEITRELIYASWPEFMMHDLYIAKYWDKVFPRFPELQFALLDKSNHKVVALGNSFALRIDGEIDNLSERGLDWALEKSVLDFDSDFKPNTQCAFQIVIDKKLRGSGLSYQMIKMMIDIGKKNGYRQLIAPVRPNLKAKYPLVSIDRYVQWKIDDNHYFDPWMRVHQKLGARSLNVCHRSMEIAGSISDWTEWTGLELPESGEYIIPGALNPVMIDIENDKGEYFEPNFWMLHHMVD